MINSKLGGVIKTGEIFMNLESDTVEGAGYSQIMSDQSFREQLKLDKTKKNYLGFSLYTEHDKGFTNAKKRTAFLRKKRRK